MAKQKNDTIRLHYFTTKAAQFYGSEKWMPQQMEVVKMKY
jgi:hypothetical protein